MWKLVKAELEYYKFPLILCYAFYITVTCIYLLLMKFGIAIPDSLSMNIFMNLSFILPNIFVFFIFIALYIEFKESRIKQVIELPVPMIQIGIARLIVPLLTIILGWLLIFFCIFLLLFFDMDLRASLYENTITRSNFTLFFIKYSWRCLLITYCIRLFSEWQGRILIFSLIILYIIGLLAVVNTPLESQIGSYLQEVYSSHFGIGFTIILPFILASLIHIFFVLRKSFLQ